MYVCMYYMYVIIELLVSWLWVCDIQYIGVGLFGAVCIHSFIHSFICLFVYSLIYVYVHIFTYTLASDQAVFCAYGYSV